MKVLIVEDSPEKLKDIKAIIEANCPSKQCHVTEKTSLNEALVALGGARFDLVVADLVLPQMASSPDPQDATPQWCEHIENSPGARLSSWIVMTSYSDVATDARRAFSRLGVAVVSYDETGAWKRILSTRVKEQFVNPALDFLIVCALEKEKAGLHHAPLLTFGETSSAASLACQAASIGNLQGQIIVLPEPGLISAAVATTKAASLFRPRAIAMPGICGGIEGESKLGDLIVPDVSWNYQVGKMVDGELKPELMQTPVPPVTKTALQQLATKTLSSSLREGLFQSELAGREILTPPMVSGSQVVADSNEVTRITKQSRKVGALDMEVAAVYSAAHDFFNGAGVFFAAKTVVDLATNSKDDRYHEYGCALSARFVTHALASILS